MPVVRSLADPGSAFLTHSLCSGYLPAPKPPRFVHLLNPRPQLRQCPGQHGHTGPVAIGGCLWCHLPSQRGNPRSILNNTAPTPHAAPAGAPHTFAAGVNHAGEKPHANGAEQTEGTSAHDCQADHTPKTPKHDQDMCPPPQRSTQQSCQHGGQTLRSQALRKAHGHPATPPRSPTSHTPAAAGWKAAPKMSTS